MTCAEAWIEYVAKHFTVSEISLPLVKVSLYSVIDILSENRSVKLTSCWETSSSI